MPSKNIFLGGIFKQLGNTIKKVHHYHHRDR